MCSDAHVVRVADVYPEDVVGTHFAARVGPRRRRRRRRRRSRLVRGRTDKVARRGAVDVDEGSTGVTVIALLPLLHHCEAQVQRGGTRHRDVTATVAAP